MFLKELRLRQFRNYPDLTLALHPGLTLIVGANGAGKSNLLEAVTVLASGESHRDAENKQLISWDRDGFSLGGTFAGEETLLIEARQERGRARNVKVNNLFQRRLRDWVGRVPVVSFSPEDLDLIKGDPGTRRRALNAVMGQAWPGAADLATSYAGILEQRNAALKSLQENRSAQASLEPWDIALLREGAALTLARREFLAAFAPILADRYRAMASEEAGVAFKPSFLLPTVGGGAGDVAEIVAANRRRLQDLKDGEIALGTSLIGPHRDDLEFSIGGRPARAFGSQGQQRTLAVAFKLAERDFLKDRLGREPICLMDDMLSELDRDRRRNLQALLTNGSQCLVTVTSLQDWEGAASLPAEGRVLEVRGGRVEPSELLI